MNRTFAELYREAVESPSPRQVFLSRAMTATGCTYEAVQKWAYGRKRPGRKNAEALAREFGAPADVLFPPSCEEKPA